jgi:RNA polymerase-binding protein DksA
MGTMATTKDDLRQRLLERRDSLKAEIERSDLIWSEEMSGTAESDRYGNHMADVGSETFEQEKQLGLKTNLERQLGLVEDALQRFEDGTYGICANCGREIDPERLEALPYASHCIDCQRDQEAQR